MPYRLAGVGGFGLSVNWEKVADDKQVAQKVIIFPENRRVLLGAAPIQVGVRAGSGMTRALPECSDI